MAAERLVAEQRRLVAGSLVLAVAVAFVWWDLLVGGLLPFSADLEVFSWPHWKVATTAWRALSIPLWNPFQDMGEPHLADPQSMAFYPPLIALAPLHRFVDYLRVWVVFHTALAAGFMAALLWRRTRDTDAAVAAAAVAALGGSFVARVTFPNHFAAIAWLPACLYFQQRRAWRPLGVALAMQWLAGFPPVFVLTATALGAIALVEGRRAIATTLGAGALGAALAAPQAIPFLELLAHSARGVVLETHAASMFSIPPTALLKELLVPQWSWIAPSLPGDPAILTFYAGPVALLLAALAVMRGGRTARLTAAGAAIALVLALGANMPLYSWLIPLRVFRFPANWLLLATAGVSFLVGLGVATVRLGWLKRVAVVLLLLDLGAFARGRGVGWAEPAFFAERPPLAAELVGVAPVGAGSRVFHAESLVLSWIDRSMTTAGDYALMRDVLFPSFGTAFGVCEARSYQVMRVRRAVAFQQRLDRDGPGSPAARWAGVEAFITCRPASPRVDPASIVIARDGGRCERVFLAEPAAGVARLVAYRPGRVEATVDVGTEASVVLGEIAYPGWGVEVDGSPAKLEVFENAFMAARVGPGRHILRFRYRPASFAAGVALAVAALAAITVARRFKAGPAAPAASSPASTSMSARNSATRRVIGGASPQPEERWRVRRRARSSS